MDSHGHHDTPLEVLKSLLRRVIRVYTQDGRMFEGTFAATDKPLNVVLVDVEEFWLDEYPDGRYVGQVIVPWRLIKKVELKSEQSMYT